MAVLSLLLTLLIKNQWVSAITVQLNILAATLMLVIPPLSYWTTSHVMLHLLHDKVVESGKFPDIEPLPKKP